MVYIKIFQRSALKVKAERVYVMLMFIQDFGGGVDRLAHQTNNVMLMFIQGFGGAAGSVDRLAG